MNEIKTVGRINRFDNLKGFAILLIVFGHLCFIYDKNNLVYLLRNFVYLVHLPIFFFVSGYFSKIGPNEPIKAFKRLLVPYILFTIIWQVFFFFTFGTPIRSSIFITPNFGFWFLISLFFMKLMLPIFDKFKYPVLISVICAILIGLTDAEVLGISGAFVYLPVFLIGFYYKEYKSKILEFDVLNTLFTNKRALILIAAISLLLSVYLAFNLNFTTISMRSIYSDGRLFGMITRLCLLVLTTVNALIAYKFMTNSKNILTKFGRNSLVVYLLHLFICKIFMKTCESYFAHHNRIFLVFLFGATFLIVFVLSRDIFTDIFNRIFNKINDMLMVGN